MHIGCKSATQVQVEQNMAAKVEAIPLYGSVLKASGQSYLILLYRWLWVAHASLMQKAKTVYKCQTNEQKRQEIKNFQTLLLTRITRSRYSLI